MNDEAISAISKVKKMLALAAKDSGATEDERMTAMKLAMALMAKHGIEQGMLADAKEVKATYGIRKSTAMNRHQINLATAAGILYGCKAVFWNGGKAGFAFVGRPDNIEAAEETLMWLMRQVDELYKVNRPKGMGEGTRQEFYRTFKVACSEKVWSRARKLIANPELIAQDIGLNGTVEKNALVVKDYFVKLEAEATEALGNVKAMRRSTTKIGNGTLAGLKAGEKVQLHRQVK